MRIKVKKNTELLCFFFFFFFFTLLNVCSILSELVHLFFLLFSVSSSLIFFNIISLYFTLEFVVPSWCSFVEFVIVVRLSFIVWQIWSRRERHFLNNILLYCTFNTFCSSSCLFYTETFSSLRTCPIPELNPSWSNSTATKFFKLKSVAHISHRYHTWHYFVSFFLIHSQPNQCSSCDNSNPISFFSFSSFFSIFLTISSLSLSRFLFSSWISILFCS